MGQGITGMVVTAFRKRKPHQLRPVARLAIIGIPLPIIVYKVQPTNPVHPVIIGTLLPILVNQTQPHLLVDQAIFGTRAPAPVNPIQLRPAVVVVAGILGTVATVPLQPLVLEREVHLAAVVIPGMVLTVLPQRLPTPPPAVAMALIGTVAAVFQTAALPRLA